MQGLHQGHARAIARAMNRRGESGKEVVHVDKVGLKPLDAPTHLARRRERMDALQGCYASIPTAHNRFVTLFPQFDIDAMVSKQLGLGANNNVFSAGLLIVIVYDEDSHR